MAGAQRDAAIAGAIAVAMWLISGFITNQLAGNYLYVVPGVLVGMAYVATTWERVPEHAAPSATRASRPATEPLPAT
jgi:hypothetical protein